MVKEKEKGRKMEVKERKAVVEQDIWVKKEEEEEEDREWGEDERGRNTRRR